MRIHDLILHTKRTARAHGQRHQTKRPKRLLPALAIELNYKGAIERRHAELKKVVDRVVVPRVQGLVATASIVRLDDWGEDLDEAIRLARATFNGITPREDIQDLAIQYASETSRYAKQQLADSLRHAIGVDVFFDDRRLLDLMKAHVRQNVDLISSIDEDYLDDIRARLTTGIRAGHRVEGLRDMIEDRYEVSRGRASLIARDQVGKFYGQLNRERQTSIGLDQYTWRGTLDQRERPMHVDLEGNVYRWGFPPVTNSNGDKNEPGGDHQCRCTGEPVLPDVGL